MQKLRLQDQHPALQAAVADPTVCIFYTPGLRSYRVPRLYSGRLPRRDGFPPSLRNGPDSYEFDFCPFSGDLLSGELGEMRARRLRRRNGLSFMDILTDHRRLPKWAITEDWWVNERIRPVHDEKLIEEMRTAPPYWPYEKNKPWPGYEDKVLPGYRVSLDEPEHYCRGLSAIFSREYMFWYLPYTCEYGPRIIDPNKRIDYQPIRILPVSYCPWCGTKLPESKRPEWEQRVQDAGFDPKNPEADGFPSELLRDAWWRKSR